MRACSGGGGGVWRARARASDCTDTSFAPAGTEWKDDASAEDEGRSRLARRVASFHWGNLPVARRPRTLSRNRRRARARDAASPPSSPRSRRTSQIADEGGPATHQLVAATVIPDRSAAPRARAIATEPPLPRATAALRPAQLLIQFVVLPRKMGTGRDSLEVRDPRPGPPAGARAPLKRRKRRKRRARERKAPRETDENVVTCFIDGAATLKRARKQGLLRPVAPRPFERVAARRRRLRATSIAVAALGPPRHGPLEPSATRPGPSPMTSTPSPAGSSSTSSSCSAAASAREGRLPLRDGGRRPAWLTLGFEHVGSSASLIHLRFDLLFKRDRGVLARSPPAVPSVARYRSCSMDRAPRSSATPRASTPWSAVQERVAEYGEKQVVRLAKEAANAAAEAEAENDDGEVPPRPRRTRPPASSPEAAEPLEAARAGAGAAPPRHRVQEARRRRRRRGRRGRGLGAGRPPMMDLDDDEQEQAAKAKRKLKRRSKKKSAKAKNAAGAAPHAPVSAPPRGRAACARPSPRRRSRRDAAGPGPGRGGRAAPRPLPKIRVFPQLSEVQKARLRMKDQEHIRRARRGSTRPRLQRLFPNHDFRLSWSVRFNVVVQTVDAIALDSNLALTPSRHGGTGPGRAEVQIKELGFHFIDPLAPIAEKEIVPRVRVFIPYLGIEGWISITSRAPPRHGPARAPDAAGVIRKFANAIARKAAEARGETFVPTPYDETAVDAVVVTAVPPVAPVVSAPVGPPLKALEAMTVKQLSELDAPACEEGRSMSGSGPGIAAIRDLVRRLRAGEPAATIKVPRKPKSAEELFCLDKAEQLACQREDRHGAKKVVFHYGKGSHNGSNYLEALRSLENAFSEFMPERFYGISDDHCPAGKFMARASIPGSGKGDARIVFGTYDSKVEVARRVPSLERYKADFALQLKDLATPRRGRGAYLRDQAAALAPPEPMPDGSRPPIDAHSRRVARAGLANTFERMIERRRDRRARAREEAQARRRVPILTMSS
ncbi:methionine adenosyltransferase [Aureococcus anophagefferens]|uniref:Methionine adenosyltransferase n=1 Tax=Aureococcus anophagefferens TaxID=44056 RepID=A0ABR1FU96_AURAN